MCAHYLGSVGSNKSTFINVSMRALLCTVLPPAPCACAAAARTIAIFTAATAADLINTDFLHFSFVCLHQTECSKLWSGVSQKAGIFRSCPLLFAVKAVC